MAKLSVTDVPVKGKRVLVRVDFNVPLDENLNISDESRILGALPTIKYLVENGAKTILCSHLGRPKGKVVPEMSLAPVAKRLAELLPNVKVAFASDSVGEDAKTKAEQLGEGEVLLLENLRFSKEEEKNDPEFAKELASLADVFVSDAFGTVHRAHASTEGVAHYLPAVCGFLIEKELSACKSGASLCFDSRRQKGRRQDRRYQKSARQMRHSAYRRRNELYILQGYGT